MATKYDRWERQSGNWIRLRDKTTVSASAQRYLWGAACGPNSTTIADNLGEFNRVNALLGGRWKIRRSYQGGTETAAPTEPSGVLGFRSMKPDLTQLANGSLDGLIESWIGSMPNGAYATIQHEMDNPNKNISAASFDAGFNRFTSIAKATNPLIKIGPVPMEFQIRKQGSGYPYCRTLVTSRIDFWGMDVYDGYDVAMVGFPATCTRAAIPFFQGLDASKPFVAAEMGAHHVTQFATSWNGGYAKGAAIDVDHWILEALAWSANNNMTPLYYNVDTDIWKLTDAETTALAAQLP